ncbi:MAG: glutamine--fructose-6-phosphate transaminase (isomerizing) [Lachnospiraceae bacterium]|nr:glutamine--fructose-6-phosphate transaminase (isomerizing) [Lachnospiraceae bacterium]
MCGIVGYVGNNQASNILLNGLSKLEYRGYDSAGVAVYDNQINIVKVKGRLQGLREMTADGAGLLGNIGIGHTRWATHGEPTVANAHPHCNSEKSIAVVHNGIIENYQQLREKMTGRGYTFVSETDTEVLAHMLDYYYEEDPIQAIIKIMHRVKGAYALGILFANHPGELYAVRKDSPLVVGTTKAGQYIASDVPAILEYTRDVVYIDNLEIVKLTKDSCEFFNEDGDSIQKEISRVEWDMEAAEKGGYEHFMLKEIHEQPKVFHDTISPRIKDGVIDLSELEIDESVFKSLRRIYIIGCGSAYHVGVAARYMIEKITDIPVEVDLASEFRYRNPKMENESIAIIVSQSGETADSLAALRDIKERGIPVIGIVNVVGSSIAREATSVLYTWAGPEISVATTKAYSAQLAAFYLLGLHLAKVRGCVEDTEYKALMEDMQTIPDKILEILANKERLQRFASKYAGAQDMFFIGRGIDYATSMEGSLKLKEISYIHSEAYAAGELKHGSISLIEDGMLCVAIASQPDLYEKTISNVVEVKSRGGYIFAVTNKDHIELEDTAQFVVYVPRCNPLFAASLTVIPLQLFGYYVAVAKGCDVDKPRNLAKSVTVE